MFKSGKFNLLQYRRFWKLFITISILAVLFAIGTRWGLAQKGSTTLAEVDITQNPQGWGDEGNKEVGVEWINDFPGTVNDRSHWDESCDGLYYALTGAGWTGRFHFTDWSAYETDFKRAGLGGSENSYVDNVDIAMICTHGAGTYDSFWNKDLSTVYFGSTHADHHLTPGDAYNTYGDKDLEFLAFDSCSVLSEGTAAPYYNRGYWAATMNGLHLLLGFKNTMYVVDPGDGLLWGFYMKGFGWILPPVTVTQAWFQAVDYVQPTVTCARVLAETPSNFNEYLHGYGWVGGDPAQDSTYYYWDHCSTGVKKLEMENTTPDQPQAMPVIMVNPRLVNENYVLSQIAPAFNMSGQLLSDDLFFYMVDTNGVYTETLQVDRVTGSFNYRNWGKLWNNPDPNDPPSLPSVREAFYFAENAFKNQYEGLPGVWSRNYEYSYDIEDVVGVTLDGKGVEEEISRVPADGVLTYGRTLNAPIQTTSGFQMVDYPVVGPGTRLKLYFGDSMEVIGMMGGTRDVLLTKDMVEVMPAEEAWALYQADPSIAVPEVPWVADYVTYTASTLGYYEMPYITKQTELIPVWIFNANFYSGNALLAGDVPVYVPAAIEYLPPQVSITEPTSGSLFSPFEPITFKSTVVGGTPLYSWAWSSSVDGPLGNTDVIEARLSPSTKGNEVFYHSIEIQVTDANGLIGTDTVMVKIKVPLYLPSVLRQNAR